MSQPPNISLPRQRLDLIVLWRWAPSRPTATTRASQLLDAVHVAPDQHPKDGSDVNDDAHILGIDPDARVHVREDILHEKDGPMLKHGLQEMAGSRLVLPRSAELRPNRDFLAVRFDRFRAA